MSGATQQQSTNGDTITSELYRSVVNSPASADSTSIGNRVQGNQGSEVIMFLNSTAIVKAQGYNLNRMNYSIMCFSKSYVESMNLADDIVGFITDVSEANNLVKDYHPSVDSYETIFTDQDDYATTINLELKIIDT